MLLYQGLQLLEMTGIVRDLYLRRVCFALFQTGDPLAMKGQYLLCISQPFFQFFRFHRFLLLFFLGFLIGMVGKFLQVICWLSLKNASFRVIHCE
jgi:hypothetical protein